MTSSSQARSAYVAGVIIGCTPVFAPIHELGHLMIDSGAYMTSWSNTHLTMWSVHHMYIGYLFEVVVWSVIAAIAAFTLPSKHRSLCLFAVGHAVGAFLIFYASEDFLVYGREVLEYAGIADVNGELAKIGAKWAIIGPAWAAGPMFLVRYALRARAA